MPWLHPQLQAPPAPPPPTLARGYEVTDKEIDNLVYHLYELTKEERKIVGERTPLEKKRRSNRLMIDGLAQELVELVEMFRKKGPASGVNWGGETPRTIFDSYPGCQSGRAVFDRVVQSVLELNPVMLSKSEVEPKLLYGFLAPQATSPTRLGEQELMSKARGYLKELVEFEAWQHIDYPIMNLWLKGKPVRLGHVTFMGATDQDIKQWQKDYMTRLPGIADMHVFARVNAPGDLEKAVSYARTRVNSALDLLRTLSFPFHPFTDACRIGVIGETGFTTYVPIRIDRARFAAQLRGNGAFAVWQPELRKNILSKLDQRQWELINRLILKPEDSRSDMEHKLLDGVHWLGESTKPDTNRARFVKIGVALEALTGGEPKKDEMLQVRGITAMLAERAAFIAGKDFDDRLKIDKDIRGYYAKRSDIVHGRKRDISLSDIDSFGILVRRLALALLEKLDELGSNLSTVEKLESWVKTQRYTLPEQI